MAKNRTTKQQKAASNLKQSVSKFSGDLEALSSQIAGLTDAIISEKNLAASKIKSERELLARKTALQNIKEDIDDIRSERRKNQDKLDRLISDQEKEAEKEKEDNRKEQNYYKDAATNAYKSGKFVSGLIFEFLGRNEKDKKQIEAERKADRQDQIEGLRNRSKELSEQTKSLKEIRNNISVLNTNIVNAEEERMYEKRDAEKTVSDISKFASVKLLDIEPEALSKLEKIISKSKAADGGGLSLTDAIGSSVILKKTLEAFSKIRPLLQAISQGGLGTTLLAITGGLAGAAASWSLFFKGLNDDQEAYNKRRETEEEDRKRVAEAKTKREDTQARSEVKQQIDAIEAGGQTATPEVIENAAEQMLRDTTGTKNEIERRRKLALALRERAKQMREETSPLAAEVPPPVEMQPQIIGIKGTSEALAYDYAPTPTKLNLTEVPPIKLPTVAPKKVVPTIAPPKAGAKPTAQVESSFTDNILGKIGSFLPTGVGSLTPTAMAATTKYTPTKAPEKQKLPFEELVGKLVKSESSGKSDIINAIGAAGLYQFTQGTAMEQIRLMKNKGIREDITKKFEGKELSSIGKDPILKYISEAKGKDGDTQQNRIKELKKQGKIASDFDVTSYIRKQYPNSVAATVASLNQEEQAAIYEQFLDPLIKAKGGKDKVDFADIKAYGFASGTYPAALRANNMNLPVYNFNTEQGKNVLSKNPFMGPWDKNADGILTAQELRDATSLMDPSIKSGSQIYTAAANNKALQQQTQGNNVVAVNNNVVTNNQTTMPNVRPRPEEPFNPLKLLYNLYPTL